VRVNESVLVSDSEWEWERASESEWVRVSDW